MKTTREHNADMIQDLCEQAGCNDKLAKLHFDQMVNRAWNPHPSQAFVAWWNEQKEFKETGISAARARNTRRICDEFKEARQFGIA